MFVSVSCAGKAKSSLDGEKEGIQIWHGNNESSPGVSWINTIILETLLEVLSSQTNTFRDMNKQKEGRQRGTWNGKKADNDFYKKIV